MNVVKLSDREEDNTRVHPKDLLEMALKEVEKNPKIRAAHIILYQPNEDDERSGTTDSYRCGLPWEREVAILSLALKRVIERD